MESQSESSQSQRQRVRVYARIRPRATTTTTNGDASVMHDAGGCGVDSRGHVWTRATHGTQTRTFELDGALDGGATQRDVFDRAGAPVLEAVRRGCRGCVLAYGQTGSGKTFSLLNCAEDDLGLVPRIAVDCFAHAASDVRHAYEVSVSMAQIYNEQIDDLVSKRTGLKLVPASDGSTGWDIDGLSWTPCQSAEDVLDVFQRGRSGLVYAETHMNKQSSRSHCIFQMKVERFERPIELEADCAREDSTPRVVVEKRIGQLTIVDLAGSERQKKTQSIGARLKEALNVNVSLFALGNVVSALASGHRHIPYRDSTLTKILEPSLSGKSQTVLLVCVSAEGEHANESANSLEFATRAMRITTAPEVRSSMVEIDPRKLTSRLRGQCDDGAIARLVDEATCLRRALANATKQSEADVEVMNKTCDDLHRELDHVKAELERTQKELEKTREERAGMAVTVESAQSERDGFEARFRALTVKHNGAVEDLKLERAENKKTSSSMLSNTRKLEAQLVAERASSSHALKRVDQLSASTLELREANAEYARSNAKMDRELVRLRKAVRTQRMDNARLIRRYSSLELAHSSILDAHRALSDESLTTFVNLRYEKCKAFALRIVIVKSVAAMSRRCARSEALRARYSIARRAAARRSTERSAVLAALERDNTIVSRHLSDAISTARDDEARHARELARARAATLAAERRADASARLHAVSADRQLERGVVVTKLARNGKRYDRIIRVNPFSGALESSRLPRDRAWRPIAAPRPSRSSLLAGSSANASLVRRVDDILIARLSTRDFGIVAAHPADVVWPLAVARRYADALIDDDDDDDDDDVEDS
jgi:hypothetical protein